MHPRSSILWLPSETWLPSPSFRLIVCTGGQMASSQEGENTGEDQRGSLLHWSPCLCGCTESPTSSREADRRKGLGEMPKVGSRRNPLGQGMRPPGCMGSCPTDRSISPALQGLLPALLNLETSRSPAACRHPPHVLLQEHFNIPVF